MIEPEIPANEQERLRELADYAILDTEAEQSYDDLASLAAQICQTPIALVSLVDYDRQWFKSKIGLDVNETHRRISFCGHAINQDGVFVVEDATQDARFADNPLVTGDPNIRFYAGAVLETKHGHKVGTLCVIDQKARQLSQDQQTALEALARQATQLLELRRRVVNQSQLRKLHGITSLSLDFQNKVREILMWGCEVFHLPMGIVSHIDGNVYTIFDAIAPQDPPGPGDQFELGNTYCAHTVAADGPVGFHHAGKQIAGHPCYTTFGLEAYIGAPLIVNGQRFGTVNFSGPQPRTTPFDENDYALLSIVTQWIGFEIGREKHIHRLSELKDSLNTANTELKKKIDDLDRFAYIVSHDLKAPLRAIKHLAGIIKEDLADIVTGEPADNLERLQNRADFMSNLIGGILEYSRATQDTGQIESVDAYQVINRAIDSLDVPKQMTINVASDLPTLRANQTQLFQVFSNLIGNAIKYHHRKDGTVQIVYSPVGDRHEFRIIDDGPGVPPEYHERIFSIFQKGLHSKDTASTGIGLAIVKTLLENNGGSIRVESDGETGSTFIFTWPVDKTQSALASIP